MVSGSENLCQRLVALLASFLQLFPLFGVLLRPFQDRVDDPIPGLGIPTVVDQDACNHHFDLLFRIQVILRHCVTLLRRFGRSPGVKILHHIIMILVGKRCLLMVCFPKLRQIARLSSSRA